MKNVSQKTISMVQLALLGAIIILMTLIPFLGYIPLGIIRATIIHVPVIIGSIVLGPKKGALLGLLFGLTSLWNNTVNPTPTSFVFTPFYTIGDLGGSPLSLVICIVPRILVGVVPYYVYKLMYYKIFKHRKGLRTPSLIVAGISGALTNTLLVMNMIYLFFGKGYAAANGIKDLVKSGLPQDVAANVIQKMGITSDSAFSTLTQYISADDAHRLISKISTSVSEIYSTFIVPVIGLNGILEAAVAGILVAAIASALLMLNKNS